MDNKPLNGLFILLVEDQSDAMNLMSLILKRAGGRMIAVAANGSQALDIMSRADAEIPDVILTDIYMPVMTGWELMKAIQSDPRLKNIPVVATTSLSSEYERKKLMSVGFADYLLKPTNPKDIIARVAKVLTTRKS